jgi:ribosomal protein S18 acetylase RimI-like enzyme
VDFLVIDQFRHDDIEPLLALAAAEGWVCDRWEFEFLLEQFPTGCLTARRKGKPAGYATSIKYDTSGWIGNLIVGGECRGQGVGTLLMERALEALENAGAATVWLTASKEGKPIYERLGFTVIDVINRWAGQGIWNVSSEPAAGSRDAMLAIDAAGWGDRRDSIIDATVRRGRVYHADGSFLVSQPCSDGIQLGPWGGLDRRAPALLDDALLEAGKGVKVLLDVPIRNTEQTALLLGKGFSIRGSSLLMYRGTLPAYAPESIYALASMGSMG